MDGIVPNAKILRRKISDANLQFAPSHLLGSQSTHLAMPDVFVLIGGVPDATGLQYLHAWYYDTGIGRFTSRDTWAGDYNDRLKLKKWMCERRNPVIFTNPNTHMHIMEGSERGGSYRNDQDYVPGDPVIVSLAAA